MLYLIIYKLYIIVHEGWKWKTPYIQVCRIIRQVFLDEINKKKKIYGKVWNDLIPVRNIQN